MLESWLFFCFHRFLSHWVQKCNWFLICVMTWRHDVMTDVMTSCHDVTKPDLPISACRYVLKSWFFFCFHGFLGHWVQILCYWFLICVMTWRHDVMSWRHKTWLTYLESWFFFCFHVFLGHWVRKCNWYFICVMTSCHDVMPWRHKTWLLLLYLLYRHLKNAN